MNDFEKLLAQRRADRYPKRTYVAPLRTIVETPRTIRENVDTTLDAMARLAEIERRRAGEPVESFFEESEARLLRGFIDYMSRFRFPKSVMLDTGVDDIRRRRIRDDKVRRHMLPGYAIGDVEGRMLFVGADNSLRASAYPMQFFGGATVKVDPADPSRREAVRIGHFVEVAPRVVTGEGYYADPEAKVNTWVSTPETARLVREAKVEFCEHPLDAYLAEKAEAYVKPMRRY